MMGIGLLVVVYHNMGDLRGFLESLQAFPVRSPNCPTFLTVTLVEASKFEEETAKKLILKYFPADQVQLRSFEGNIGYARACNDAALAWSEDPKLTTYAFFNADTEMRRGVL